MEAEAKRAGQRGRRGAWREKQRKQERKEGGAIEISTVTKRDISRHALVSRSVMNRFITVCTMCMHAYICMWVCTFLLKLVDVIHRHHIFCMSHTRCLWQTRMS